MAKTRFDIHYAPLTTDEYKHSFKFASFGAVSVGIQGLQYVVNAFAKCLLTPRGSDPTDLAYGTEFTGMIGSNINAQDARDVVTICIDACVEQIRRFQNNDNTLTPKERLASATLLRLEPEPSIAGFSIYVLIQNQAGTKGTAQLFI